MKNIKDYTIFYSGQGHGFIDPEGNVCQIRCFNCGLINWTQAIRSGKCRYCDFDANTETFKMERQCE